MYIHSDFFNKQELTFPELSKHLDCTLIELEPFAVAHRKDKETYPSSIDGFFKWLNYILTEYDAQTIIRCTDISIPMLNRLLLDTRRQGKLTLKSVAMINAIMDHFLNPSTKETLHEQ